MQDVLLKQAALTGSLILMSAAMVLPAKADSLEKETCGSVASDPARYQLCLLQTTQWLEGRVRLALDKAMIAAAEKDAASNDGIGYGLNVRLLDQEQLAWESELAATCGEGVQGVAVTADPAQALCVIPHLEARYEALTKP